MDCKTRLARRTSRRRGERVQLQVHELFDWRRERAGKMGAGTRAGRERATGIRGGAEGVRRDPRSLQGRGPTLVWNARIAGAGGGGETGVMLHLQCGSSSG